ncbi:DUF2971 domain-containing protein [Pacificispira sp.]|uniref:DUF2971 domain-containing protein n=1 Tax=Pacificispira sp. TaxID=2888761 RepID=UPI003B51A117
MSGCPKAIYKYMSAYGFERTIQGRSLKLSRPRDFNDPFDIRVDRLTNLDTKELLVAVGKEIRRIVTSPFTPANLRDGPFKDKLIFMNFWYKNLDGMAKKQFFRNLTEDRIEKIYDLGLLEKDTEEFIEIMMQRLENSGIFCSSTETKDLLMWSHYADSHKGFLLEITPSLEEDSALLASKPVSYSEFRPTIYSTPEEFISLSLMIPREEAVQIVMNRLVYTKGLSWAYEKEYRLWIPDYVPKESAFSTISIRENEISKIIIGCRCDLENNIETLRMAKEQHSKVRIFKSHVSTYDYDLTYEEIDI